MVKKKVKKAPKKLVKPQHNLPDGFWQQIGAVVLIVLTFLLVLGIANTGGIFPVITKDIARYLFGWGLYVLPLLLVFRAVQIFRADNNRVPITVTIGMLFFLLCMTGFLQLMSAQPEVLELATGGQGGGVVGWLVAKGALTLVSAKVGALVMAFGMFITGLFVLSVSPQSLFEQVASFFRREKSPQLEKNTVVAERARVVDDTADFKMNEGVPTVHHDDDVRPARLHTMRNSIKPDVLAEEQSALTSLTDPNWEWPSLDLLEKKQNPADAGDVKHNAQIIKDTLREFNIDVEMEGANIGPKVTQYTLRPPSGVKLSRISALETNIALNLAAQSLRIEAPIPGQRAVGIEVPNRKAADVRLYGILHAKQWKEASEPLSFVIGKDIAGDAVIGELNKMPHILIAGQTGSGKSVMINTLLTSLLYRNSPSDMRLILVDPKKVEMAPYADIPHLLAPIIDEPEKTISALKWAVNEMERRYDLLAEQKIRDISNYNSKMSDEPMPYIVVVIDELSDLMMIAARDVEALIVRLAQKARAVGIHLVLATQRPSVDVITGLIKANIPARIAFTVASQVDSRTILDQIGAEKLLGRGDMLILTPQMSKPKRIQGALVTDDEVFKVTEHLRLQAPAQYNEEIVSQPVQLSGRGSVVMDSDSGSEDSMYLDAVRCVIEGGKASTSYLQRRLRIGYSRAARLIEEMEEQGIIGPADGSKPREVLVSSVDALDHTHTDDTTDEFGIPK